MNFTGNFVRYFILTLVLTAAPVFAQQTKVNISPARLDLVGMQGEIITESLLIETPQPIERVQLVPPNLHSADRTQILPPAAVEIPGKLSEPARDRCQASNIQTIAVSSPQTHEAILPVCFDLNRASSGEFTSQLRVSYQGGQQLVPIALKVKDYWAFPLLVLLVGTGLGIVVSAYRDRGQPRDEILVPLGRLRTEMQEDAELAKAPSFQAEIEAHLYDVKVGLQGDKLDEARNGIDRAEQVWAKWIKGRSDWLAQLAYWEELNQRLQDFNPNIPYVQLVRRELEDTHREASSLAGPDKLRDRLDELAGQINRFLQVRALDKQLRDLLASLSSAEKAKWESKILAWERQIDRLDPSELTQYATLAAEMEGAIADISQSIGPDTSGTTKGISIVPHLAPPPAARPLSWERQAAAAGWRLRWFTGVSYAIALLFLTGAGFDRLYLENPTFGANPWKDYLALLAWGFGAEASRDAVTKMIQGWKLPNVR